MTDHPLILCIWAPDVSHPLWVAGYKECYDYDTFEDVLNRTAWCRRTDELERNASWLQVIPYCYVTCNGHVLTYRRGKGCGEARLRERMSIGFGGHPEYVETPAEEANIMFSWEGQTRIDDHQLAVFEDNVYRELKEELPARITQTIRKVYYTGLVHETVSDVGRVHLGVVIHIDISCDHHELEVYADDNSSEKNIAWLPISQVIEGKAAYENWSQLVISSFRGHDNVTRGHAATNL